MEVGVPQAMDIVDLVAADLALLQALRGLLGTRCLAFRWLFTLPAACLHEAPDRAVGGQWRRGRLCLMPGHQIVVVQRKRLAKYFYRSLS